MQRTDISTIGEFALIRKLTEGLKPLHPTTQQGVGDDAAVIAPDPKLETLVSHELFLEGIHFDLTYTPLKHLGYKAVIAAISDLYAMNAEPRQILVGIGVSARFSVEDLEELYAGIRLAAERYQLDLVGGDTTSSLTGLTLSLTVIGAGVKERLCYRHGAKPTDLICVTGDLGAAYMGLQLLEREKRVFAGETGDFEPDFAGREYILERQLRPEARRGIVEELARRGIVPTSMIDVSDGLASELRHIARESGVGIRIYEDRLPIDYETASMAEEFNLNVTTVALNGGDDYELLFTIPLGLMDQVKDIEGLRIIGHVTEENLGACLVARDGSEIALVAQGWKD
ncbi:MAG: thiamine-phosphate kinase [Porphyromonas sp.]|nr:thiamine-phosphate kinase [Porphyromonas sp.]